MAIVLISTQPIAKRLVDRAELTELGIHVAMLSPGYVRTNLSLNALLPDGSCHAIMDSSTANGMDPEVVAKVIKLLLALNIVTMSILVKSN